MDKSSLKLWPQNVIQVSFLNLVLAYLILFVLLHCSHLEISEFSFIHFGDVWIKLRVLEILLRQIRIGKMCISIL